jgi:uncharacterized protein YqeY
MSEFLEKINRASVEARKARDTVKAGVLGMVLTDVLNLTKAPGRNGAPVTDEDVMSSIKSWVKKTNDAIEMTVKGHGDISKLEVEKQILMEFLPKQMDANSLETVIASIVQGFIDGGETKSPKLMGKIMGELKARYNGEYDSKMASDFVKKSLT